MTTNNEQAGDDLDCPIWGAENIAKEIKKTKSQAFHLLEAGHIPATKVGRQWVTTRRRLRQLIGGSNGAVA
jgi:hypothetical protein